MKWQKKKLILATVGVLYVGALGAFGYLEFREWQRVTQAQEGKKTSEDKRNGLLNGPYTLSEQNAKIAEANLKNLENAYTQLLEAFPKPNLKNLPDMDGLQFADYVKSQMRIKLSKEATNARIILPPAPTGFAFGFNYYLSEGVKPSAMKSLLQQIKVVQQLVENLIDCKVLEIKSIRRTPADGELSTTSGKTTSSQGDYFIPESRPSSTGFSEMPFELVFVADNTALQKFLNLLAESYRDNTGENKRLFLIRRLETETVPPPIVSGPTTYPNRPGVYSASPSPTRPEEHVHLAGDEKVKVTLRVDWVQVGLSAQVGSSIGASEATKHKSASSAPSGEKSPGDKAGSSTHNQTKTTPNPTKEKSSDE